MPTEADRLVWDSTVIHCTLVVIDDLGMIRDGHCRYTCSNYSSLWLVSIADIDALGSNAGST